LRCSYRLADRVVAISQGQASWIQKNDLVHSSKLTLIQQCLNLDRFFQVPTRIPTSLSTQSTEPLILAAYGRFCTQKGFDILLQAMRLIPDVNLHLNMGGSGGESATLHALAQGAMNIKFWGTIDHSIPAFLAAADVVLIPSRWEPWGTVCLEAKAAGKPIIASDVDGLSEQVQACGLLVPPNDPRSLAAAIRTMADAPVHQLKTWGHNARASVDMAWERYLDQWRSLLWQTLRS
jgi:glycosyltransferase involved in cell wall biosynthesis